MNLYAIAVCLQAAVASSQDQPELWPGDRIRGEITEDCCPVDSPGLELWSALPRLGSSYPLYSADGGPYHISLRAPGFDAYLVLRTAQGELVAEDDDGLFSTHACLEVELDAGAYYVVQVCALWGTSRFELEFNSGRAPKWEPNELRELTLEDARKSFEFTQQEKVERLAELFAFARYQTVLAGGRRTEESVKRVRVAANQTCRLLSLAEAIQEAESRPFSEVVDRLQAGIAVNRKLGNPDGEAQYTGALGIAYDYSGETARARELYEIALSMYTRLGDARNQAACLQNLGDLENTRGHPAHAIPFYERALALSRKAGDKRQEAGILHHYGSVQQKLGNYAEARELFGDALGACRDVNDEFALSLLSSVAKMDYDRGDWNSAEALFLQIEDRARTLGRGHLHRIAMQNLAAISLHRRELDVALERLHLVLDLNRRAGDLEGERCALASLSELYLARGEYILALEHAGWSLDLARLQGNPMAVGSALNNLGRVHAQLGNLALSLQQRREALAIFQERSLPLETAIVLGNIASVLRRLGQLDEAHALQEQSLELSRRQGDSIGELSSLNNLGRDALYRDDLAAAREFYRASGDLAGQLAHQEGVARSLGNLAALDLLEGDLEGARKNATESDALWNRLGMPEFALDASLTLAEASVRSGDLATAARCLEVAHDVLGRPGLGDLSPDLLLSLRSRFSRWAEVAQEVTALQFRATGDTRERQLLLTVGLQRAAFWKGRALLVGIVEHEIGGRSHEILELRRERREVLQHREDLLHQVTEAVIRRFPSDQVEVLKAEAAQLRGSAHDLQAQIDALRPTPRLRAAPAGLDLDELRTALPGNTLLVEYVRGLEDLFAYSFGSKGLAFHHVGLLSEIAPQVLEIERLLQDVKGEDSPVAYASKAQRLYETLCAPFLSTQETLPETIVVVPCAEVAGLPFGALVTRIPEPLPADWTDLDYLADRLDVVYAPSTQVLVELSHRPPRQNPGRSLLIADPLTSSEVHPTSDRPQVVAKRLEQTRTEVLSIARTLLDWAGSDRLPEDSSAAITAASTRRSCWVSTGPFDLALGSHARPSVLAGDLRDYSLIHVAAHGIVDREFPDQSGLLLGPELVDFLGFHQILEMDLDADLVVLSACSTARGPERSAEGVLSLAWAFLYAGSRGVVASLWEVQDDAASETMTRLHENLVRNKLAPGRALSLAQRVVRRLPSKGGELRDVKLGALQVRPPGSARGHPGLWAPFVYVGPVH